MSGVRALLAALGCGLLAGAGLLAEPHAETTAARPEFADVSAAAGLRWQPGLVRGDWNLVETMGGGGGFVDYDGDGWLDLYMVSYSTAPGPGGQPVGDALYRNNRDGSFSDVSASAGLGGLRRGMGLAVADYDGDGRPDVFVSAYGESVLYHNEGGRFRDVTLAAGVGNRYWGCSTTFLDYDRDGRPDLFVSNYLEFDPARPGSKRYPCELIDGYPFCTIARFEGQPSTLYRNKGAGTFEDASAGSGIGALVGKGMGVVAADLDDDGWVDVFQTNDSAPNFLFRNLGNGRFADVALEAEVAFDPAGRTTGAMATDAEDVDADGRLDLVVTNFNNQGTFLQKNLGGMRFAGRGNALGLGMATFRQSTFGARFLDYDGDGDPDLFIAAGHPFAPVAKVWPEVRYAEPPFLFENEGGRFTNVAPQRGEPLREARVGRGLAVADYDNDGDPDVLLLCVGEPPRLLRNDGGNRNRWLGLRLVGTRSGRDAIGARVALTAAGRKQVKALVGGASYLTASDPRLLFGLGSAERVDAIEVRWPSGQLDRYPATNSNQYVTLTEGSGKVEPYAAARRAP